MTRSAVAAALALLALPLAACGGGDQAAGNEAMDGAPAQSVNTADGINLSTDTSGTTGSSTGDAGGPLNIANDAAGDAEEANAAGSNES